jgi:predicted nuclease of predicted toxin-antitoxin system
MVIADENINYHIIKALREIDIDVLSISEQFPGISDEEVIQLAINSSRIVITEDKDFGEWVFAHNKKNISVILLRYHHTDLLKIISALLSLFNNNPDTLITKFITLTKNKIRIRQLD